MRTFSQNGILIASRDELLAGGARGRTLTRDVRSGRLVRVYRDHYALAGTPEHILRAVRVGGRLACVSALADREVFVFRHHPGHVHVERGSSRLRSPSDSRAPLPKGDGLSKGDGREGIELHWRPLLRPGDASAHAVSPTDAVAQAIRCQPPRMAVATLDSALNRRIIGPDDVRLIFDALPHRFEPIRSLSDGRAEAGSETILRLLVRAAGLEFDIQVFIDGVGRVDMLIEGCLVVEADSRAYHSATDRYITDRTRDTTLAMLGYLSLRLLYEDIMFRPERVVAAILGLLRARTGFRSVIV
ncbi:Very-short-patch-repair endonuclease [Mycetocola miduiensis]|uniref:Very-short-patch-repair endonuclease n=2 Tax=Mycetocola miduiensis TaxID=995034 RepID=A0A1I4Y9B6_9MICO|nr:Very-short-patch-repair endonuclease [Mycetocola miduiensis]